MMNLIKSVEDLETLK